LTDDLEKGVQYLFKMKGDILYMGKLERVDKFNGMITNIKFTNVQVMNDKDIEPKFNKHEDMNITIPSISFYKFYHRKPDTPLKMLFLQDNSNIFFSKSLKEKFSKKRGGKKYYKTYRKSRKNRKSKKNCLTQIKN
jgi:hypothetical protein